MNTHRIPLLAVLSFAAALASAQSVLDPSTLACDSDSGMLRVIPLYTDSLCSSFLICIPREVPLHYHKDHTEHVVVLEGAAIMQLGDTSFTINAGRTIIIPKGTPHAVRTTSSVPLRVISVQSPYFDGSDRILITR